MTERAARVREWCILETEIRFQERLGYRFRDCTWLRLALTHRSVDGRDNNERLEFLGDALLGLIISDYLYRRFPESNEGGLTRLRASMVKEATLAQVARQLDVGAELILGQGEIRNGGFRRDSILADTLEALIAAIYCDHPDIEALARCVLVWFEPQLAGLALDHQSIKDAKSQLQEWLQARHQALPTYEVVEMSGPPHAQKFSISCRISSGQAAVAEGDSRRRAEQAAAAAVLKLLQQS